MGGVGGKSKKVTARAGGGAGAFEMDTKLSTKIKDDKAIEEFAFDNDLKKVRS